MLYSHCILAIFWIGYCTLHSVLASAGVKVWIQKTMKVSIQFYRIGYTIFSFLGLVGILIYQFSLQTKLLFVPSFAVSLIGIIMMASGAVIMVLMIWKYFMQLSGLRWLSRGKVSSKLEVNGLHRYVRHPLYLGTFVFLWGWFLLYPSLSFLICCSFITIYTLIGLRFEEKKLIKEFGDEYVQYQKKVPRLIPKFHP
jgi:protein-S-isoprenylcysteine O-methyltransferase Ste14